ncbi:hypothetical protein OPQ81_001908 [Rhizoctonia solani]|nr:hypothetical protein OPQ81_001908 [Rhizoctonia solani]
MSSSSVRGSSDSVHQANLATFQSFRKTIEDLTHNPRTVLGDHASLVRRIQEWRKTVSHLTVWVTDDRAYYQQARPEIVSLLEAVFDSVRAVDTVRSQIPGPNWVRASEKEFEYLLQDYIKLIEIAFPPHRQSRYNTPGDQDALNRGRILYNGLYSFKRRLEEVRGIQEQQRRGSAPQLQQNPGPQQQPVPPMPSVFQTASAPHAVSQVYVENGTFQNGASDPIMRPYVQPHIVPRTHSLPAANMIPMRPAMASNHSMPDLINGVHQLPLSPRFSTPPQGQAQLTVQNTPIQQPPPPPSPPPTTEPAGDDDPSFTKATAPSEEQDWDLDINWDELEALDRSEWQDDRSKQAEDHNSPLESTPIVAETINEQPVLPLSNPDGAPRVEPASMSENTTLMEPIVSKSPGSAQSAQSRMVTHDASKSEIEDSTAQRALPENEHVHVLANPKPLAEDVIDIDELSGDEEMVVPHHQTAKQPSRESVPPTLDEDVINIQYSEDEMEVDELDPSESPGSIGRTEQPNDMPSVLPSQGEPSKSEAPQPPTNPQPVPILNPTSVKILNSLPPHVRAEIRQKAKEPLIAYFLSITSSSRETAEARFREMSDQEVFDFYEKTRDARKVVDHYKNRLVQSSRKIHLPHIDVREPSPGPPTLLSSVNGVMRLSSETVEFSISPQMMASLERWRTRFVTPVGSHGELITAELACYPKDAFHTSEGKGRRELTLNAQTRTWPDGGYFVGVYKFRGHNQRSQRTIIPLPTPIR